MGDEVKNIGSQLASALNQSTATTTGKKNVTSKDEFLMMLVQQLKNQDPMDPMKPDQFAVNLAQFSQLEQLVNINNTLEKGGSSGSTSLAAYLGQEVAYASDTVRFEENNGGKLVINLPSKVENVQVQILNPDGSVKETKDLGAMEAGRQKISLDKMQTASGEFGVKVVARGYSGQESTLPFAVSGVVTGFIPGADPVLLVGEHEVKPDAVLMVSAASGSTAG